MDEFPLMFAQQGDALEIKRLSGGQYFKNICIAQGLFPGQEIKVFSHVGNGACLVIINDCKVMIGRGMLKRIIVQKNSVFNKNVSPANK